MPGPLAGIRVLELARILAGPWAGQILADLGADVVKVERKGTGDDTRGWGPPFVEAADGKSSRRRLFPCHQSRQALDRAGFRERGRATHRTQARSALGRADREFQGRRSRQVRSRLCQPGKESPRLIYCSVTGFGQDGPYASRAGYDLMAQGIGGIMDLTGDARWRAAARRCPGRRYFHRRLFGGRHPGCACRAPAHRAWLSCRYRAGRQPGRRARQSGAQLSGLRRSAQADRQRTSRTSCHTRFSRSPTATSSSRPATTTSSPSCARCSANLRLPASRAIAPIPIGCKIASSWSARLCRADRELVRAPSCWRSSRRCRFRPGRSTASTRCLPTRR